PTRSNSLKRTKSNPQPNAKSKEQERKEEAKTIPRANSAASTKLSKSKQTVTPRPWKESSSTAATESAEPSRLAILRIQERLVIEFLQRPAILQRLKELEFPYVVRQESPTPCETVAVRESLLWHELRILGLIVDRMPTEDVSVLFQTSSMQLMNFASPHTLCASFSLSLSLCCQ
ncbi:MAG: hypothetical protein P4M11_02605, partial [Candidatus Pacebacteria bacterium]|nr:hypothetical protein [Candidatus Paceibacterota bacterium]